MYVLSPRASEHMATHTNWPAAAASAPAVRRRARPEGPQGQLMAPSPIPSHPSLVIRTSRQIRRCPSKANTDGYLYAGEPC